MNRCHKILQGMSHALVPQDHRQCSGAFEVDVFTAAVIYARLLEHYFHNPAEEYLQDPTLVCHSSYKPLSECSETYSKLLQDITVAAILSAADPKILTVIAAFNAEFLVGSCEFKMFTKPLSRRAS